jgi:hypothetical protein
VAGVDGEVDPLERIGRLGAAGDASDFIDVDVDQSPGRAR